MSYEKNTSDEVKIVDNNLKLNKLNVNSKGSSSDDSVIDVKINDIETTKFYVQKKKKLRNKSGFKSIVHKVMSWNSKSPNSSDKANNGEANPPNNVKNLKLHHDEDSDDNLCRADWLRAKDSLENLLLNRELNSTELVTSKSMPLRKEEPVDGPHNANTNVKNYKNASAHSISKVLAWDPWDKLGKKGKRDTKRRKDKISKDTSYINENIRKDVTSGDELRQRVESNEDTAEDYENYQYQPYRRPKNVKSVDFTNEVRVVYFSADQVLGEGKEPLKKELDQQIRNKEMRRGHCPATMMMGNR